MTRILLGALVALGFVSTTMSVPRAAAPGLPRRLDDYLTCTVRLNDEERTHLLAGAPVAKLLDADESKEVAVFGAVWVDAPMRGYVGLVEDIENFERGGGFKVTRRIGTTPRLEDFAELRLSDEDVSDLRTCRIGNCNLKLDERALERFQTEIDWNAAGCRSAVDSLMRRLALTYVTGYLEGGDERLAVYRDKCRPTFVAREFREMTAGTPELSAYMPDIRRYLLDFPKATIPDSASFLYWQETQFGLKPTIRISHVTIREGPDNIVVASKMLYASHYFWTALELRTLLPDPSRGPGFWFVSLYRGRADGLSGFTGRFVRRRVESEALNGALTGLRATKRMLEGGRHDGARP